MRYNDALEWGEGVIANDVFKTRKIIEFLFTTKFMLHTVHLCRRSNSRNSNRQVNIIPFLAPEETQW